MQGRIQVVEQSRCRTHRQQTTTIAETQSPQSVLIVIENLLYFYKYRLFLQTESDRAFLSDLFLHAFKIPLGSILEGSTFFILRVAVKSKLSGVIGDRVIFKSGKLS